MERRLQQLAAHKDDHELAPEPQPNPTGFHQQYGVHKPTREEQKMIKEELEPSASEYTSEQASHRPAAGGVGNDLLDNSITALEEQINRQKQSVEDTIEDRIKLHQQDQSHQYAPQQARHFYDLKSEFARRNSHSPIDARET